MHRLECSSPLALRMFGFTLLEVMVAMTIAGMALGALLGVIGGNKRLSYAGEEALVRSAQMRSHVNLAQLSDGRGEVLPDLGNDALVLHDGIELAEPDRKTQGVIETLRGFEVRDANGTVVATGTYWVELPRPQ